MLHRIETFELPERFRSALDRSVLALGVFAFASALIGTFIS